MKLLRSDHPTDDEEPAGQILALLLRKQALFAGIALLVIFTGFVLISCKNDLEEIKSLSFIDTLALESARDIEVIYSDSGRIQATLKSPRMNKYQQDEEMMIFPEGFELIFYDSAMTIRSVITANYGKVDEKNGTMEAKNNVVVINKEKHEELNTEHLVWDQKKGIIFSDVFVKIITEDEIIYGDGLTSDQEFNSYTIKNPSGEFTVEQEEL